MIKDFNTKYKELNSNNISAFKNDILVYYHYISKFHQAPEIASDNPNSYAVFKNINNLLRAYIKDKNSLTIELTLEAIIFLKENLTINFYAHSIKNLVNALIRDVDEHMINISRLEHIAKERQKRQEEAKAKAEQKFKERQRQQQQNYQKAREDYSEYFNDNFFNDADFGDFFKRFFNEGGGFKHNYNHNNNRTNYNSNRSKSAYDILGIPVNSDKKVIKDAYRKLCKQYHPDMNPDADVTKFHEINNAYKSLIH